MTEENDIPSSAEEEHSFDAKTALFLNLILIVCVLLSYYIKQNRIYYLPESAAAMLVGLVVGGLANLFVDDLALFSFSPEVFFFVLLPPIIFEAGYSLNKKRFFENMGAIILYAMFGTMISTFVVGYILFLCAQKGWITSIDKDNAMEPLLFGALISAVDPVATLSIMGSPELQCDQLLYSIVFGESVLNDAIAIVLFKTFRKYYDPEAPSLTQHEIPGALLSFFTVSLLSVVVGVLMGLVTSFIYKHTSISKFPKFETALLFLFCYLCYAIGEALELSGIMALFFNGIILNHYNSYNLSETAHTASDQIFSTLAVIMETIVFLYMGMGVFTGQFDNWDVKFTIIALLCCFLGRFLNIFPLSWIANLFRKKGRNNIPLKMQGVLWFAGLRGAIAFALAENMPGPNKDTYTTVTLSICIFTTVVCGGLTEKVLSTTGMKQPDEQSQMNQSLDDNDHLYSNLVNSSPIAQRSLKNVHDGLKGVWKTVDNEYLKPLFGGSDPHAIQHHGSSENLGDYEMNDQYHNNHDDERSSNF